MTSSTNRQAIGTWMACLIVLVASAASVTACGDSKPSSPPGSPSNPLVGNQPSDATSASAADQPSPARPARGQETRKASSGGTTTTDRAATKQPGYQALVDRQSRKPKRRFTPCNLVTRAEAGAIVGTAVQMPLEAPQGPTCIYRAEQGKDFITLAVQNVDFRKLRSQMSKREAVSVAGATAYCGTYGQPMLYLPLAHRRLLSIAAPCDVAQRFAIKAVPRLAR